MTTPPKWLEKHQAKKTVPKRKGFPPGVSGNPKGRPKGSRDKKTLVCAEFEKQGSAIAKQVIAAALGGDMTAANIALQRISPPLKARSEKVKFKLDPDGPLTAQAQQVLSAVASGEVDPDSGKLLIDCIAAFAGIKGTDELEERLDQLEARMGKRT